jgi:hypothetical protein
MMNWNPRRRTEEAGQLELKSTQRVSVNWKRTAALILAVMVVLLAVGQPILAQAVGPVYALPGTLTRAINRSYDTILTIANGTQYGLVGQTPDIEGQIVLYREQGAEFEVKVWGDRYPAASESELEYIVVSSILPAVVVTPTAAPTTEATATPTVAAPTATPVPTATPQPTVAPTPVVPVAVVQAANVNVRGGPGTEYPRVGSLVAGQTCAVTGRNGAASWWQLSCPGVNGWVLGDLLALGGPISTVSVVQTAPPPTPAPPATFFGWRSSFFSNQNLSGNPVLIVDQPEINFNWGTGSPGTGVPVDNFSARFERTLDLTYGTYEVAVTMDDGARVYIDDVLMINAWNAGDARTRSLQVVLSGARRFRVEYFEVGGTAQLQFRVNLISSSEAWTATYHNGIGFGSTPILTRGEPRSNRYQLDYNWGRGAPAPGLPVDQFSVRWIGTFNFEGGDYRFNAVTDDGIRVYIDGILILDRWQNGYYDNVTNTFRSLGAGNHQIVVEYYEAYGDALVRVWWERLSSGDGGGGGSDRPRDE